MAHRFDVSDARVLATCSEGYCCFSCVAQSGRQIPNIVAPFRRCWGGELNDQWLVYDMRYRVFTSHVRIDFVCETTTTLPNSALDYYDTIIALS